MDMVMMGENVPNALTNDVLASQVTFIGELLLSLWLVVKGFNT